MPLPKPQRHPGTQDNHLSHERRFATHVRASYQHAGGLTAAALILAANYDVIGNKIIAKESLCDAWMAGISEFQEGRSIIHRQQDYRSAQGSITTLTVVSKGHQDI